MTGQPAIQFLFQKKMNKKKKEKKEEYTVQSIGPAGIVKKRSFHMRFYFVLIEAEQIHIHAAVAYSTVCAIICNI